MDRPTIGLCFVAILVIQISSGPSVLARPKYEKVFTTTYEVEYSGKNLKIDSCTVCHEGAGANKSVKNHYGDAIRDALRKTNAVGEHRIREALKSTEEMPSAIEGKTFGDLIKDGKLPASKY